MFNVSLTAACDYSYAQEPAITWLVPGSLFKARRLTHKEAHMKTCCACLSVLPMVSVVSARAAVMVFDFEDDAEIGVWRIRTAKQDKLARSPRFATSGRSSMVFTTPAWKKSMEQWPAFEARPPVTDWRAHDRLAIDVTNPNSERCSFSLFISDSKTPFRKGLSFQFDLPASGFRRSVVPLSKFPNTVDRSDIAILHFFSQRPATDLRLHFDNIVLLKPGEMIPDPPSGFARQVAHLLLTDFGTLERLIEASKHTAIKSQDTPELRRLTNAEFSKVSEHLKAIGNELRSGSPTLARLDEIKDELAHLPREAERVVCLQRFHKAWAQLGMPAQDVVVGFATSMEKILPRNMPFELTVAKHVEISLARNEKESFQIAVLPLKAALRKVSVRVNDLRPDEGKVLQARNIDCDVVGYVETRNRPPYAVSYVGWWPDPILDFLGPVDIAPGDLQTFWIRLRTPKTQPPGTYAGKIQVCAQGLKPLTFGLTVKVRSFALPDHTPLPTAITFFEPIKQVGGKGSWQKAKFSYANFLADYYIDYDSLYRLGTPDYEIVKRLHDRGRLVAYNLGNVFNAGTKEEGFEEAIAETLERIRPAYQKAKELGLLDHAYIYGFDERPKEQFVLLERSAQALRKAFPEILLMTTSYDDSYGLDSVVKTIDAWCPLTPRFDVDRAARARDGGKKVWWYICCGPHNPYANWFVEYAAIDARLLMGAMTAKYHPDGFLYYALTIWNQNRGIEKGPFTAWNPVSWTTYHGDGSLFCCGPGGKPVPTIRLENYRDGMEDFAYACILEEIIRQYEARKDALAGHRKQWLAEAKAALPVPESLVKTMAEFSRDPKQLYAYRNRLADLIDRSGMPDANPWGEHFGVRGLSKNR